MGNILDHDDDLPSEVREATSYTNFTMEEVIQWYDHVYSQHPTGHVTIDEFKQIYREQYPDGNPDEFAERVFRLYDTDRSGFLNFREFISGLSVTYWKNPRTRIEWVFKLYDLDKNGFITVPEMTVVLQSVLRMSPTRFKDIPMKLPLTAGELNAEAIAVRIFEKYDRDNEGRLAKEDLICLAQDDPFLSHLLM